MEEIRPDSSTIKYKHKIEYRSEETGVEIEDYKDENKVYVRVRAPILNRNFAIYYKEKTVRTINSAKKVARTYITESTTEIDKQESKKESVENFFESVDEAVDTLEDKTTIIDQEFEKELDKI